MQRDKNEAEKRNLKEIKESIAEQSRAEQRREGERM